MANYERFLHNSAEEDPLNVKVRASLDGTIDELQETGDSDFWSKDRIKEAALLAQREDKTAQDRVASQQAADAFIAGHPEFIDNTANAHLLLNQVKTMFGEGLHTIAQWEQSYEYLRTNTNFLKLDPKEVEKQRKADAKARFDASQHPSTPSTEELYSMPLEDLRRLATVEHHKRMQEAGERGGNGW